MEEGGREKGGKREEESAGRRERDRTRAGEVSREEEMKEDNLRQER